MKKDKKFTKILNKEKKFHIPLLFFYTLLTPIKK